MTARTFTINGLIILLLSTFFYFGLLVPDLFARSFTINCRDLYGGSQQCSGAIGNCRSQEGDYTREPANALFITCTIPDAPSDTRCPDGSIRDGAGECPTATIDCPDGQARNLNTDQCESANPGGGSSPGGTGSPGGIRTPGGTTEDAKLLNPLKVDSIEGFLIAIIDIILIFALPIVILFIMYAGFLYVTARGDTSKISTAHTALTWAIIGGVIVFGAKLIIELIKGTVGAL